jgi:hypothetical protein
LHHCRKYSRAHNLALQNSTASLRSNRSKNSRSSAVGERRGCAGR